MIINVSYDQSASALPAGFTSGISDAVNYLASQISTPITIDLHVGYGEVGGQALPSNALGASSTGLTFVPYSLLHDQLIANATSADDRASIANLPAANPTGATLLMAQAEAVALGILPAGTAVNVSIGFSTSAGFDYDRSNGITAGQYDFFAVVLHEVTETMGRILGAGQTVGGFANAYMPLDFFHFSAAGARSYTTGGYFSPDNGTTNLGAFNTVAGADYGDWASSMGPDSFSAFATKGVLAPVSQDDLREMDVLGYTLGASGGIPSSGWPGTPVTTVHAPTVQAPALINNSRPTISGTADANDQVTFYDGSKTIGSATVAADGTFKFVPGTALADGSHTITANASDAAGTIGPTSAPVTIVVDTHPPAPPVLELPTLTKFNQPLITGTAEANSTVTLFDTLTKLGTTQASSSGAFSFLPAEPLADGSHSITANATDAAGNTSPLTILPMQVNSAMAVDHLGTNGNDSLQGSGSFYGGAGDDFDYSPTGSGTAIYSGPARGYDVVVTAGYGPYLVHDKLGTDGSDTLMNVPMLQFTDQTIDTASFTQTSSLPAAQLTQLVDTYIAYFNRAPDAVGLDFWGGQLSKGLDFHAIANQFVASPEAQAAYPATMSNQDFVTAVYNNVLGRIGDAAGFNFWVGQLQSGVVGKGDFVLNIVQSVLLQSGTPDAQLLANKYAVGAHFALTQGLSDGIWAKSAMVGVDGTAASVTAANAHVDSFAATAASTAGSEFVVKIVGIAA